MLFVQTGQQLVLRSVHRFCEWSLHSCFTWLMLTSVCRTVRLHWRYSNWHSRSSASKWNSSESISTSFHSSMVRCSWNLLCFM